MRRARAILFVSLAALVLVVSGLIAASATQTAAGVQDGLQSGPTYSVTFTETGLPVGTNWTVHVVNISGYGGWHQNTIRSSWGAPRHIQRPCGGHQGYVQSSTSSSIGFTLPNGTYFYWVQPPLGFVTNDGRGIFNVTGSSPPTIGVSFTALVTYSVTFTETGLPSGTNWTVTVSGGAHEWGPGWNHRRQGETSDTSTITFLLTNGTYRFGVAYVPGFAVNVSRGFLTVDGASPPAVSLAFSPVQTYSVTFGESGLPASTNWSVWVFGFEAADGQFIFAHATSSAATIGFEFPNGSYSYFIGGVPGWHVTAEAQFGSFNINGASLPEISVVFSQYQPS